MTDAPVHVGESRSRRPQSRSAKRAESASITTLTSLGPSTAMQSELQSDVDGVQTAWSQVQSDAQAVQSAPTGDLDSACDSFASAVKGIPDAGSVSNAVTSVTPAAQQLDSAAKSTAASVDCGAASQ
jgi:hypothetical protein